MERIEEVVKRARAELEKRNAEMKESGCRGLSEPSATKASTVISECPVNVCDGSGLIYVPEQDGYMLCKCRVIAEKNKKLSFAQIPVEFIDYKIASFDTKVYSSADSKHYAEVAKKAAIQFIKKFDDIKVGGKGLYFYSQEKGSGKTRLMASIGNALIGQHMQSVRFTTTNNLLDRIKESFGFSGSEGEKGEDYATLIKDAKEVDVLLLDDFGAERSTEWVNEIFYSIINDRMTSKKITLFTSNYKIEELPYDYRTVNRVMKMAIPIKFPEESIRLKLAYDENEEFMKMLLNGE